MGKVIIVAMASVDGYYEGPGGAGDLGPLGVDDGFNGYNAEVVERAAVVVVGHHSFRDFSAYWPDRASAQDASPSERRFAAIYNSLAKVVASRDPDSVEVPVAWSTNTRVAHGDIESEVARLREATDDGDILLWGSRNLWTQLLRAGLVDELHVVAGTGVAQGGTPMFPTDIELTPLETRRLPDSKCVLTTYAVRRPNPTMGDPTTGPS